MRTAVRQAYDEPITPSTAVAPVVMLASLLRASGVPVATSDVLDGVRALAAVDLARRDDVRAALRATMAKDGEHESAFGRAFAAVFPAERTRPRRLDTAEAGSSGHAGSDDEPGRNRADDIADALVSGDAQRLDDLVADAVSQWAGAPDGRSERHHAQRVVRAMDLARIYQRVLRAAAEDGGLGRQVAALAATEAVEELQRLVEELVAAHLAQGGVVPGAASTPDGITDRPFLRLSPTEVAALRAAVRPLARTLATRLGRRRRRGRGAVDVRRTVRRSIGTGGVPLEPVLRRRHRSKPDLVVLCDVSGSMSIFAPFMLALVHAVQEEFSKVRSFVFVDGVVEVTDVMSASDTLLLDARDLLDRRGLVARDGRSDYAHALQTFLDQWPDVVTTRTAVVIAGDGRSHDRPPAAGQLAELARASRHLYWLDPEPTTEWDEGDSAMAVYTPHCDGAFEVSTLRQLSDAVAAIA